MNAAQGRSLVELISTMATLRAQCPWKAEQTHRSLARYLLEETHETLEAIDSGDPAHLREELGDLLLQVYFHAAIAAESGDFDIDDVASGLQAKLVRRNPHVFGDEESGTADQINERWQAIKNVEKHRARVTDGIAPTLPALLFAEKVVDRLERQAGTRAVQAPVTPGEVGTALLALVEQAHGSGVDPEQALRDTVTARIRQAEA